LIAKNGSYRWGESKGLLKPVKPWYAEAGKNYFRINDLKGNSYDFWYKPETDQLILLFGEVGGHAASGYRWPARKNSPSSEPTDRHSSVKAEPAGERSDDLSPSKKPEFIPNARVEILWSGSWFKGQILAVKNNSYLVRYDGWGSLYDEWVTEERIRLLK
jgi:hypothetical protein